MTAIVARGLRKRFGAVEAVRGIDLEVGRGTVLGMLGPNGAGKTTVVRMLTTVLRPDAGEATVLGFDVARQGHQVRSVIGMAGQSATVDENLTATENLDLVCRLTHVPKPARRQRITELLVSFELQDAADRPVRTFSGGMRRRLDLAAALVHSPPVLFLDEPTSGLDPRSRLDLWDVIRRLVAEGVTVLLTTQYLEEADELADRIVVVDHGVVIAQGTSAELKSLVGGTVVRLTVDQGQAARVTEAFPGSVVRADGTVDVQVDDAGPGVIDVVRRLGGDGVVPRSLLVREPSLDDVFLRLTGHGATVDREEAS